MQSCCVAPEERGAEERGAEAARALAGVGARRGEGQAAHAEVGPPQGPGERPRAERGCWLGEGILSACRDSSTKEEVGCAHEFQFIAVFIFKVT